MKPALFIVISLVVSLCCVDAFAFWGSENGNSASGLNVTGGFDVNTVKTVSGSALTLPEQKGQEQGTLMTVAAAHGVVTVVLGPWWYWEKHAVSINKNHDITITGSLAQGKDGGLYLFAQRLENRSTGESVTLRSETGKPFWSRGAPEHQSGVGKCDTPPRGGNAYRGYGMRGGRR